MSDAQVTQIEERCRCHCFEDTADFERFHYSLQRLRLKLYPLIGHDNFEIVYNANQRKLTLMVQHNDHTERITIEIA